MRTILLITLSFMALELDASAGYCNPVGGKPRISCSPDKEIVCDDDDPSDRWTCVCYCTNRRKNGSHQ